ncbi:flagellar basal body rod protein FlgB [Pullulanibacillus sp. KACC 23026]|uniref:flagellar basal body rod protein FlgB n=1 Tax=Pullulanibacillus sp. KACC 23026 TaxID=3028315 RepID=UPI0023B0D190|nr:flagellar basal body rod protein FlgB [Pullulanibacillus sp. KACC 23026]WEG11239.1 flagellar basal body rod protein FlgB [Pullulanibacillus sp. KACC 23026]
MNSINVLQKALDASSLRQQVISNNIANADTPGYKSQSVSFENILKQHLAGQTSLSGTRTDPKHFVIGDSTGLPNPQIVENSDTTLQNNGNNVDIDQEMTNMSKNSLWYYSLTNQINNQFQELSIAITGRRS